ncbi:molybdenum cofactor guanylyltransferase [Amycolatopsis sp. CA-230715]|uniref:molybdenum cofactor guanylyltransferase n=1 Tax=Amycolatopsis sp. CA-230715 TaxID=2745196 RepID=UPI001C028AF2|nr:NTP transferase domain-containing protein [Amycolatopsis sp. CA-230715]QWF85496.1 Molybdenum cofactor guanylyltransferase [Amycolatopsis sp. CA-230715]
MSFAGLVLAGGAASRLSGVDKPMLEVGGEPLLRKAVRALGGADEVIVVGSERPGFDDVVWTSEHPPRGGPVAALAAGLALVRAEVVVVLAGDLARVEVSTVDKLRAAVCGRDGALLVDAGGYRQWLAGAWRTGRLRAALAEEPRAKSLRAVMSRLDFAEIPDSAGESADVDTPEDYDRFR